MINLHTKWISPTRGGMLAATVCGVLLLGACQDAGRHEQAGTAVGAGGGAVVGAVVGGWQGAAIGAVAGGIVGNLIGRDMDHNERRYAEDATWRSAREGRRSDWEYRGGGRGYSEPAGDFYTRDGQQCREFDQFMTKNGREYRDRVTICRNRDGSWRRI